MLYNSLKSFIDDSGFNSVNDFIVYILRDSASTSTLETGNQLTEREIETIKGKLKNLGYLT